jgi:hypothetical protein
MLRGMGWFAAWVSSVVWLCAPSVSAQATPETATEDQKKVAFEAYSEGKKLYEVGDYAGALEHFTRSQGAVLSANTRLMYARTLSQLGRKAEAFDAYGEVPALTGGNTAKYGAAVEAAEVEQNALQKELGQLTVQIEGEASSLSVGGRQIDPTRWGQPIAVDPGMVEVVAVGPSGERRQSVGIGPAESQTVRVLMGAHADQLAAAESTLDEPLAEDEDDGQNPAESRADVGLVIGGKVGGGLGKPWSDFGVTPVFELELGYMLPPLHRAIEIFVIGQYAQPGIDGESEEADPRLPGTEPLSYEVTQQWVALSLGALYRIDVGTDVVMPYGGLGARMYMLKTTVKGRAAGESFGENDETQMDYGLMLLGGVDIFLGPGALLAELSFGWAQLDGFVMRDTNLGALSLAVGYRVML